MHPLEHLLKPNKDAFGIDPFGYSALAWQRWCIAQTIAGVPADPTKRPTSKDLKSPVLWLLQAHALSEAATIVLRNDPTLDSMPSLTHGTCDSQYRAVGLMLVAYSLEICLKAMLIISNGIEDYSSQERRYKHHRLEELATFIPWLNEKDRAILRCLSHFSSWAGRYPDPGSGREGDSEEIFSLSEQHRISGKELFELAAKVMKYTQSVIDPPEAGGNVGTSP